MNPSAFHSEFELPIEQGNTFADAVTGFDSEDPDTWSFRSDCRLLKRAIMPGNWEDMERAPSVQSVRWLAGFAAAQEDPEFSAAAKLVRDRVAAINSRGSRLAGELRQFSENYFQDSRRSEVYSLIDADLDDVDTWPDQWQDLYNRLDQDAEEFQHQSDALTASLRRAQFAACSLLPPWEGARVQKAWLELRSEADTRSEAYRIADQTAQGKRSTAAEETYRGVASLVLAAYPELGLPADLRIVARGHVRDKQYFAVRTRGGIEVAFDPTIADPVRQGLYHKLAEAWNEREDSFVALASVRRLHHDELAAIRRAELEREYKRMLVVSPQSDGPHALSLQPLQRLSGTAVALQSEKPLQTTLL